MSIPDIRSIFEMFPIQMLTWFANVKIFIVNPFQVERVFSSFARMVHNDRKSMNNQSMEAVLQVHNLKVIMACIFENVMELFLTEFPNGEIRSSKHCLDGYMSTHRKKKRTPRDKRQDLELNLSSSESETDSVSSLANNEIWVQPGEDLEHGHGEVKPSLDDYSLSDNND